MGGLRTIGVAKKLMTIHGDFEAADVSRVQAAELPALGDSVDIVGSATGRIFGLGLRTSAPSSNKKKDKDVSMRRVYVSIGNRVSMDAAKGIVLKCCDVAGGSYIPEPIRMADLTGRAIERAWEQLHKSSDAMVRQWSLMWEICSMTSSVEPCTPCWKAGRAPSALHPCPWAS